MEKEVLNEPNYVEELVALLKEAVEDENTLKDPKAREELSERIEDYHENDIAGALELLTAEEREKLYPVLGIEKVSEIFSYFKNPGEYVRELDIRYMARVIENMDSDDAVDIIEELDDDIRKQLPRLLNRETKAKIRLLQSYDEDEIGSHMTTNYVLLDKDMSVKQAMRSLVTQAEKNDNISILYVCDEEEHYYGALDLKDLIIARGYSDLEPLVSTAYPYVYDHEKVSECVDRILEYQEDSIPVLSQDRKILGIITAQDLVEVVDDEMGEDYAKLAGLTAEEDLKEPLAESMKKRMPWLIVLLFLGMIVSTVVGLFENVVSQVALIVCFQSLILDMAGNVGTQSLAVTIRVLMDENLKAAQKFLFVLKEVRVGMCNGILLGSLAFIFIGIYIAVFKGNTWGYAFKISGCVGVALLVAMMISSLVGTVVPLFFHKIKVDPAVASGPLITTVNDLVAVVTYYGLAWVLLIRVAS